VFLTGGAWGKTKEVGSVEVAGGLKARLDWRGEVGGRGADSCLSMSKGDMGRKVKGNGFVSMLLGLED
jgi:hypothetical protein